MVIFVADFVEFTNSSKYALDGCNYVNSRSLSEINYKRVAKVNY